jgi:hypothetical protein
LFTLKDCLRAGVELKKRFPLLPQARFQFLRSELKGFLLLWPVRISRQFQHFESHIASS